MTKREQILGAVLAALRTVPGATVLRNASVPQQVPAAGIVILRDGDPGVPDVSLNPPRYYYEHAAEIEVYVKDHDDAARDAACDLLVFNVGQVLVLDRTFGGLTDYAEAHAPVAELEPIEGSAAVKHQTIPFHLTYFLDNPLG